MQALRAAQLGELVTGLAKGIDTHVGECGCRLSGGQRQRIGIARALYRQADVLSSTRRPRRSTAAPKRRSTALSPGSLHGMPG